MKIKRIDFSNAFLKQYKKAPSKIRQAWIKKLEIFKKDSLHPQLKNHLLKGKLLGYRSINITGDWRAIYTEQEEKGGIIIVFQLLGTHSQLYG